MMRWLQTIVFPLIIALAINCYVAVAAPPAEFFGKHCFECHSGDSPQADLDLTSLPMQLGDPTNFSVWVRIHDRIASGEMPPRDSERPLATEITATTTGLQAALVDAELARLGDAPRTAIRRLTRAEYENTMRDLFELPGIVLQTELPADGTAHGFDKNSDALDISHVNLAKYIEAADRVLDMAIATQPEPPAVKIQRISLANEQSTLGATVLEGDAVILKHKQPDPNYPPAGSSKHLSYPAHLALGMHSDTSPGASVGVFRHEDDSFKPSFAEFIAIYPGMYRVRTAFWSFLWDKGKVLPANKSETARLDVWHITGDGRGTGHPNTVLGYFDAPSIESKPVELVRFLNTGDSFGFNFTGSQIGHQIRTTEMRLMGFTGPGLACDGLEVEGPIHEQWPPASHRLLFGELPLVEFRQEDNPQVRPPVHPLAIQKYNARNQPDPPPHTLKLHTVHSDQPVVDARRLLANFLPRAFRRPITEEVVLSYVGIVEARLAAGDCFEVAMRRAYRAALCSPDFLYHIPDKYLLASRLSYFLWNSPPDKLLLNLATEGKLEDSAVLRSEVERLLSDEKAVRFHEDFLGQWLKLRKIAANDPDPALYGEFRLDLQDAMVAETHAFFQELLKNDLDASYLVKSDFAMLNERLAKHYNISGVEGCQIRRVALPVGSTRGPFLTQASILKITANGTTTSPVPRGAFVLERFLGQPPQPPPPNVAAVEPDVRGATTIRQQLDLHRHDAICASCHAKIDPPGFALESFDVIGAQRLRYQSTTDTKPLVDPSGELHDGRKFADIREFQELIAADKRTLLKNLAEQFAVYSLGRGLNFSDRDQVRMIVDKTEKKGGGIRTLIHELVQSELFRTP